MEKISVIVPIYNSEKFLEKCLSSLVQQTYPNLEILLINDCSTDNSGLICKDYCAKHENINYFEMAENRGVSHSRNFGIENATGALIGFVDSDDWADMEMYESLYGSLIAHGVPMVSANYRYIASDSRKIKSTEPFHQNDYYIDNTVDALLYIINRCDVVLCNKLFRREIFDGVFFAEGTVYEDVGTIHYLVEKSKKMAVSAKSLYNYNLQPNSITRSNNVSVRVFDHLYAVVERYNYLSTKYNSTELERLCKQQIFTTLLHVVNSLSHINISKEAGVSGEYEIAKSMVYSNYSYSNCGFNGTQERLLEALGKSVEHYKISRDLLRV